MVFTFQGYDGSLDADGQRSGHGRQDYSSGNVYVGGWLNNRWHGSGRYVMMDGSSYEGNFEHGRYHGSDSVLSFADGREYVGEFHRGHQTGLGTMRTPQGTYRGEFVEGSFHGVGEFMETSGNIYVGEWKDGKRSGMGLLLYAKKESKCCGNREKEFEIYFGEWCEGRFHGKGALVDVFGEVFDGSWDRTVHARGELTMHGPDCHNYTAFMTLQGPHVTFFEGVVAEDYLQMLHMTRLVVYSFMRICCCCYSSRLLRGLSDVVHPSVSKASLIAAARSLLQPLQKFGTERWRPLSTANVDDERTSNYMRLSPMTSSEGQMISHAHETPAALPAEQDRVPIRLINFNEFRKRKTFPRFPDDQILVTHLDDIDAETTFFVFLSHCWISGHEGAEDWRGYPHVDNKNDDKLVLCIQAVEIAWRSLAPGMEQCYVWCDYGCINQDGDPAGELKDLMNIVRASDCIITPIVDPQWMKWRMHRTYSKGTTESSIKVDSDKCDEAVDGLLTEYKAPLWSQGPFAYLNRAWCRMEMLYAANVPLQANTTENGRIRHFRAGLKSAALCGRRPHLLYGTSELDTGEPPLMLEPLQNSYLESFDPFSGSITKETDRSKIRELMEELTLVKAEQSYTGDSDSEGRYHGKGRLVMVDGDVYEGMWREGKRHGYGIQFHSNGDTYEGDWVDGIKIGEGRYVFANGREYEGHFERNMWNGHGRFQMFEEEYTGNFVDMEMTGLGRKIFKDGSVYSGEFIKGERQGKGECSFPDGRIYKGDWNRDHMNGRGALSWTNRRVYVGEFVDNRRCGKGIWVGEWGMVDNGHHENDTLHGPGTRRYLCCPLAFGPFINDQPGTICPGWVSVGVCAVPCLSLLCTFSLCSFPRIWDFSVAFNRWWYREELGDFIIPVREGSCCCIPWDAPRESKGIHIDVNPIASRKKLNRQYTM